MTILSVAAHKVRYRVRHFGGVFTFPSSRGEISIFAGHGVVVARAARDFFKDLAVLAAET